MQSRGPAKRSLAQRCAAVAAGQTKAAEGGCRAEQTCERRSIAAAALAAAGPKKTKKNEKNNHCHRRCTWPSHWGIYP